ncbi:hypothetical protein PR048_011517 [Dryococelus australis]|uniref:Uncharacterized protein n=1 Tax=Dryococelus australis TaxID=614101 RepID=A0ABQ9HLZ7_9NEOP|nr:hypothetical protein PR048_011517 [Dryococelus australis]
MPTMTPLSPSTKTQESPPLFSRHPQILCRYRSSLNRPLQSKSPDRMCHIREEGKKWKVFRDDLRKAEIEPRPQKPLGTRASKTTGTEPHLDEVNLVRQQSEFEVAWQRLCPSTIRTIAGAQYTGHTGAGGGKMGNSQETHLEVTRTWRHSYLTQHSREGGGAPRGKPKGDDPKDGEGCLILE